MNSTKLTPESSAELQFSCDIPSHETGTCAIGFWAVWLVAPVTDVWMSLLCVDDGMRIVSLVCEFELIVCFGACWTGKIEFGTSLANKFGILFPFYFHI